MDNNIKKAECKPIRFREFENFHPAVNFIYFFAVIAFSMVLMHPVCLFVSLVCSIAYSVVLKGKKAVLFSLFFLLPVVLTTALLNPAFNHEGVTIVAYLPSGNPLTAESVFYGIAAGCMLAATINWFSCFNEVMSSDKFVWLFARFTPSLSLVLSMALRFVPLFKTRLSSVVRAQKNIGRDISSGSILKRLKCAITVLSVMITWSLENSIETADSMKSRGYGTGKRTSFSIYKLSKRDKVALVFIVILAAYVFVCVRLGKMYFRYFPSVKYVSPSTPAASAFAAYFALCVMPVIIEFTEAGKWK